MLHPAMAHFAVSLPIISMILGFAYLYRPSELMSKVSTRFFVFAALFMVAAFFSGKHDGGEVYMFISGEGQLLLKDHKSLGLYLTIAMFITAAIKFYGCHKQNKNIEIVSIVLVTLLTIGVLYQGKMGGELVYQYGAHVANHSNGMDCLDDPEEFLNEDD